MFFDTNYLIWVFIPTLLLSLAAQFFVKSAYSKWGNQSNSVGLTGAEVAQRIIGSSNVGAVQLEAVEGELTDHYDPKTHIVRMSRGVGTVPSVAAMAVVAHELGHAQQHAEKSLLITARNFLVPAVQFSPTISYALIFAGLFFQATGLLWAGILFFGVTVIFMILTLPVEFDASRRGLILLEQAGLMANEQDRSGSRQVLTAAALTYVAAAVTAVLQLLYYISLANRRR
ncbi:MAG: zinc metallopeptidase [Burkholderiales bacterium]|nr:zinc metallopeptidase [Anaerolineae bacterium]